MRRHVLALFALLAGLVAAGSAQAQNRFWLVNETGRTIERAYVSSSRVSNWGPDILGTSVLPYGERVWVVPSFGDCVLDLRVTFQGGGESTRMQVNACRISQIVFGGRGGGAGTGAQVAPSQPAAMNPSFNFVNGTNTTIRELYVSLATDGGWGQDRLGTQVMRPGQRVPVSLPAGVTCAVDMRVVYMDGRAFERRRQQTCNLNSFVWR
ncbi:Tat pathway signal protein [Falsiroseomonas sp.]|uniref:Tat pathway signal protein n=1 Tax=Falsiroseomonas sp. TaxID=2870721 RepID=UPI00271E5B26|nr:Tat pathway signal protein [Falsiroseomonas sp.]MDO9499492.1 Tat pathway signal protein [Falsiroseomonas sp.]